MASRVHDREELAAFQDDEVRLVYAQYRSDPDADLYYLEQGMARDPTVKALARTHLLCPIPGCVDPRLHAVNRSEGSGYRDGFSHRPGAGNHSPETLFHEQAKLLIQAWATRADPTVHAVVEQATDDRTRRADVMLTWPDGARAAVEVQYSSLTVEEWQRRQDSYISQRITPIWLFGHTDDHLRISRADPPRAAMSILHRKMVSASANVLWINPIARQVGTPWMTRTPATAPSPFTTLCNSATHTAYISVDDLYDCTLDRTRGITTPTLESVTASNAAYEEFLEQEARRQQLEEQTEAERRQRDEDQKRAARKAAEEERALVATRAQAWPNSELYRQVTRHFHGEIPKEFGARHADDEAFDVAPEWWHYILYGELFTNQSTGTSVTYADCCAALTRNSVHPVASRHTVRKSIIAFLRTLEHFGLITVSNTQRDDTPVATAIKDIDDRLTQLAQR